MNDESRWPGDESADSAGAKEDRVEETGPLEMPVDPGDPELENVAFVVLGTMVALFVLARIAGLV